MPSPARAKDAPFRPRIPPPDDPGPNAFPSEVNMGTTIESIDNHLMRTWARLTEAKAHGRPTSEYRTIIDTLLDERLKYTHD